MILFFVQTGHTIPLGEGVINTFAKAALAPRARRTITLTTNFFIRQ